MEKFIRGKKYTEQEYIELSIEEMRKSISEHSDKTDPKVGAVLVDSNGAYFDKAHRGELRLGDHGEFTAIERKNANQNLSGYTIYTTLEPCVKRNFPKMGCSYRIINARISKVVIGHEDPDPSVATEGIKLLQKAGIEVDFYERKYEKIIASENKEFFKEAKERAEKVKVQEINSSVDPIENIVFDYQLSDLSEEAQITMINQMNLPFKFGSDAYHSYLQKMSLIKIDKETGISKPTGLGLLLLASDPTLHFPQARIKFTIRNKNDDPIFKDFQGPLILIPKKIEEYLEFVFPKGFSRSSFQRTESAEVSETAVLEVIMNALVHRDYSIEGARIMVDIDDDKIEVSSPGVPLCSVEKLNNYSAPSVSRNAKIAHIFFQMGFVEERGFGLEELSKLEDYGLPKPKFLLDESILKTILYRNVELKDSKVQKSELPGLAVLQEHEKLTVSEFVKISNIPERSARRYLNGLVTNNLALKEGKHYILIN